MTVLRTCCCCGSLRTGTIFTAIAGAILAAAGIIMIYTLNLDLRTILLDNLLPKWAVKLILAINFCMTILISMLLLYGAIKRHMYFMLPWVILGILLALGLLISVIYTAVVEFNEERNIEGTIWLIGGIIAVVVYLYFWCVVYSYFQIVRKEFEERSKYER
ncbi:hypothetical protein AMK59_841, partial [Oryctes borbonicus]